MIQNEPQDPREEVKFYFEKYHSGQQVIVVTGATHMHRALSEFQKTGITAHPSPTN